MGCKVGGYPVLSGDHRDSDIGLNFRAAGYRGFDPRLVAGCVLYLDPALGITLNGSTVSAWANQGTAGGSVSQGTAASQPTWSATGGPNSRAGMSFDGGDWLASDLAASAWAFLHSANSTVFVVWRTTSANPNTYYGVLSTCSSGAGQRGCALFYDDRSGLSRNDCLIYSANNGTANNVGTLTSSNAYPAATWNVLELAYSYLDAGNDLTILRSGTSVATAESTAVPSASAPAGTLEIGRLVSDAGSRLVGSVAEVIAFDRTLTAAERSVVRRYLSAYYAITVA